MNVVRIPVPILMFRGVACNLGQQNTIYSRPRNILILYNFSSSNWYERLFAIITQCLERFIILYFFISRTIFMASMGKRGKIP